MAEDGSVVGVLTIDAASLTTKNRQRDQDLRSANYFDVANHPWVVARVTRVAAAPAGEVALNATLEAAGRTQSMSLTSRVLEASSDGITLAVTTVVDRTAFGMTWSPLGMASGSATLDVELALCGALRADDSDRHRAPDRPSRPFRADSDP
jgi:polyisoprenoid-binding protein YceI